MPILSRAGALGAAGSLAFAVAASGAAKAAERVDAVDAKALNASLALERSAVKVYTDALAANLLSPPVAAVITRFQTEHSAQRDALAAALTQASATVSTDAAPTDAESFKTEGDVLAYAYTLERSIAYAYVQSVGPYKNREYATLAASILGATTTHVALLAEALRRGAPYPTGVVVA